MRQPSLPTKQNYLAPNNNRAEIENPQPGVDSGLEATGNAVPQLLVGVVVGAWGGGGGGARFLPGKVWLWRTGLRSQIHLYPHLFCSPRL